MSKAAHLFNLLLAAVLMLPPSAQAGEAGKYKKQETGLYRDIFDQNIYYEGTNYLHLDRFWRDLFHKEMRSANVNLYDEVPDSAFFTNRHGRTRLSPQEIEQGPRETDGPDLSQELEIVDGKFEGLHPGFFVRDARGDPYLLKFDPADFLEQATSAEVIASRFYHAIGYHVPQYTIALIEPEKLIPAPEATIVDDTGFKKRLTQERLSEYLLFLPQDPQGHYRASASKILAGISRGYWSFHGRRKEDPNDPIPHRERREIRALQVFSSWLANYDIRESNTLDVEIEEGGRRILKHYLIDFNTALGSGTAEGKPPMSTHEHLMDYGEAIKALFTLGWWEKPWQKRWRDVGEKVPHSPAVGYFDNRYFDPGKFKTQLPHYAFKDLTRADGFWAAKIIMSFTDEDIHAAVKAGELTSEEDAAYIAKTLAERRDIMGRYWFERASPLDAFELADGRLTFQDLAVTHGFLRAEDELYLMDVVAQNGKRAKKLTSLQTREPSLDLGNWLATDEALKILIRASRPGSSRPHPYVLVEVNRQGVQGVLHED